VLERAGIMPKTGALRTRLWLHRKFIFNFKLLSLFSIHCPRSLNAQSLYQFPSLSSSLLSPLPVRANQMRHNQSTDTW